MEELDFRDLLDHFISKGFQKGEQVILGHFGTVQTLLSLIFETSVNVKDIQMTDNEKGIHRSVNLVAGERAVCHALSLIPRDLNSETLLHHVSEGKLGLGQIVVTLGIPNQRRLIEVGRDKDAFWRTYAIEGHMLYIEITEHFPRAPFEAIGWIQPEVRHGKDGNY